MSSDGPGQGTITSRPVLPPEPPVLGRWLNPLRATGLAAGVGALILVAPALRPAEGPPPMPLLVSAEVERTGEVMPVVTTQLVSTTELRPSAPVTGSTELVSVTGQPVAVTLTSTGAPSGAHHDVHALITLAGDVVHDGTIAQLRKGSTGSVRLEKGQFADLEVALTVPDGAEDTHQGRTTHLKLKLTASRVED